MNNVGKNQHRPNLKNTEISGAHRNLGETESGPHENQGTDVSQPPGSSRTTWELLSEEARSFGSTGYLDS